MSIRDLAEKVNGVYETILSAENHIFPGTFTLKATAEVLHMIVDELLRLPLQTGS